MTDRNMWSTAPWCKKLKRARTERLWSQGYVAERLDATVRSVGEWERGEGIPNLHYRSLLCLLFKKEAHELGLDEETIQSERVKRGFSAAENPPEESAIFMPDTSGGFATATKEASALPFVSKIAFGTTLQVYNGHTSYVVAVDWCPKGSYIASAGGDGTIQVWDAETGQTLHAYRGHPWLSDKINWPPTIYTVMWSPDGKQIASAGSGPVVFVWDAATLQNFALYKGHSKAWSHIFIVAWSPNGKQIASACSCAGWDKTIHLWDPQTSRTIRRLDASYSLLPGFSTMALAWSPDGSRIAAVCGDKTMRIWDCLTGQHLSTYRLSTGWVYRLAWSTDGKKIAMASIDSLAQILDVQSQQIILTYYEHTDRVRDLAWSPDGKCIVTVSNDTTAQIWDAETGARIYTYRGHTHWVTAVAWSPDGSRIVSASNDKTLQVWYAGDAT